MYLTMSSQMPFIPSSTVPGAAPAALTARVRLVNAARLRFDPYTDSFVLLSPERGLRLNASASEIVGRCTGEMTGQEIARDLFEHQRFATNSEVTLEQVTSDVVALLTELRRRGVVDFEHCA